MKIPFFFFDRSEYVLGEHRTKHCKEILNCTIVSVKLLAQDLIN